MGLLPKRKKKRQEVHGPEDTAAFWGEQAVEEEERIASEDTLRQTRKAKWWRRIIVAIVFVLFPFALFALLGALNALNARQDEAAGFDVNPPGKVEATVAIETWLSQAPAPLPGARLLAWDSAKTVDYPADTNREPPSEDEAETVWEHIFTLEVPAQMGAGGSVKAAERYYQASLLTTYSKALGARVYSDPALLPLPFTETQPPTLGYWPGVEIKSADNDVVEAINKWAAAYAGADPAALKLATGDPDKDHVYIPLGGLKAVGVEVVRSGVLLDGETESNLMVVEIELSLDRKELNERGQPYTSLPATRMDVLVSNWDTGSPTVVAWGTAGAGHLLTPFENAALASRLGINSDFSVVGKSTTDNAQTE